MSSKFLDKTGLDTLWAKIKSTFQTLGNLVTTSTGWGSTPSDTKYPSEKLVKTALDAISTNARTIPQDISKGANLVVNGSGRMSSNYNFSGFTYLPTICYNGSAGSFGFNGTNSNNEFISCDFNKKIVFSADIRNLVAQPSNCAHRIYVAEYDIDKKSVIAPYVMFGVGTLTELTQDLNPGDTVVHLADLSNANWLSATTYQRGFIFWNYQNSYGYLYPPETYSRNVYPSGDSNSLWDVANVNVSAGTITLNSGWTGPAIPAGTKVSRRNSSGYYPYPATITTGNTEWHSLKGYVKGIVAPGTSERVSTKFSQGTAFIKVGMYPSNLTNTDTVTGKRAVVTNFFVYEEQDINDGFGTLPVNRGGTGATTAIGAEYSILNQVADIDTTIDGDRKIALCNQTKSASNGVFRWLKLSNVWTWIKGLLSSESGVNISGNAATATTAAGYTSGGAIDTALQGKATPADITSAIQALDVASQGGDGKYIKAISEADGKISATAETMDTAPTASSTKAVTSGGVKTALDGKQDVLGISSSGDAGKFLNEQGSWQVPVAGRSDGHSVWYRNNSWNAGQLLNQYVGRSTTWNNSDNYDLTTLKAGDTIKIYITVTNMANAHFVMDLKVTEVSSVAPTATVMAIYQADQNEVLDGTDADADNFMIPGNYILQKVTQVSKNWPGANSGSLDYTNLCVTRLVRNDSSSPYSDTNNIQQSVRWASRQLFRTKVNGTWGSWRTMPMCKGNYYAATGSATKPVYVGADGSVTACKQLVQAVTRIDTSNMDSDVLYVM